MAIGPYKTFSEFTGLIPAPASVIYEPFIPKDHPIVPGYLEELRKEPGSSPPWALGKRYFGGRDVVTSRVWG